MMLFAFDDGPAPADAESALSRARNNSICSVVSTASSSSLSVSLQPAGTVAAAAAPATTASTATAATIEASTAATGPAAVSAVAPTPGPTPRTCSFCHTTTTPMWRHGPVGYDPLCNSCGVKWKRGRILHGLERAPKLPPTLNLNHQQPSAPPSRKSSKASLLSSPSPVVSPAVLQTPPLSASPDTVHVPVRRRTASLPAVNNSLPYSTSGRLRTQTAPARLLSASADARSIDAERRGSFVCQALEHVHSDASLRVVAEAVRVIQGRKMSVDGHLKAAAAAAAAEAAAVCEEAGYMEIDLDVKDLSFTDWEYLWGVLGSVSP
ncbi:hypothetical protein HDU83_004364 [Entophlyctis luteolus]|nr:hypothetical protein HDU83_004364 [Entophlyctis luteolus]